MTGNEEKTFPALPPSSGRGFAHTWWGRSWLSALEDGALDGEQIKAGRRYARSGAVGAVSVRPGGLTAVVRDRDGTAYRTDVLVQEFTAAQWDRLLGSAAAESGYVAALLDREVPPELAEDAAAAGVELLPGMGDLDPRCDCGEWDHCPHSAALCYQVARLLDQDPFVLLLLRGRGERELVAQLETRSTTGAGDRGDARPVPVDTGLPAADAFAVAGSLPPLPPPPGLPGAPGQPPTLDTGTEPDSGPGSEPELDVDAVEFLAQAAANEAYRLLALALAPGHADRAPTAPLTATEDAVRLTAEASDLRVRSRLTAATGRDRAAMDLAVRAWGFGGPPALAALEDDWAPDRATLARARATLGAAWADERAPVLRRIRARWTEVVEASGTSGASEASRASGSVADRQLRLGREGRWWPYRREAGRWCPAGPSAPDPASAWVTLDTG
ncbi:SWF or SNF family helicase [Streptomyces sp. NPDC059835]|uniref:SWIM zinc finger family protein n=1 Tax=Streptomyces sp. NPDC059835 TaxID=3346967 RepID=UPI003659E469